MKALSRALGAVVLAFLCGSLGLSATVLGQNADPSAAGGEGSARVFDVRAFGAKGDGVQDDQIAIDRALKAAGGWTQGGPSRTARVVFPPGRYSLGQVRDFYAIHVANMHDVSIEGLADPAHPGLRPQLIGAAASLAPNGQGVLYNSFFKVENSWRITIANFFMDKAVPYFAQGTVAAVDVAGGSVDVQPDPGFLPLDSPVAQRAMNIVMFFPDAKAPTWDHSDAACRAQGHIPADVQGCDNWHIKAKQPLGNGGWRFVLDRTPLPSFAGGKFLLWRNLGWQYGVLVDRSDSVTVRDVFYTGGGGPAVHFQDCTGDNLIENVVVDVPPGSNRLFAATSGFNGARNRGTITLRRVQVRRIDDDAFHFAAGTYFPALTQAPDRRGLHVALCYEGDIRAGDRIAAWNWAAKAPIGQASVVSSAVIPGAAAPFPRQCAVELDGPLPPLQGMGTFDQAAFGRATDGNDRLVNLSLQATLTVEDSVFSSMRAHCGIIQEPGTVRNNICRDTPFGGFLIGPEYQWSEGYAVNGVTVAHNTFDNVGGAAIRIAAVRNGSRSTSRATLMAPDAGAPNGDTANRNIRVLSNTFRSLGRYDRGYQGVRGAAVTVEDADGIVVKDNKFEHGGREAVVVAPASTRNVATP